MVRGRLRPQLGLRPSLQDGAALKAANRSNAAPLFI
jgi:hypothetical protein